MSDRLERELERQQDQIHNLTEIIDKLINQTKDNQVNTAQLLDYIRSISKAVVILTADYDERNGTKH